MSRASLLVSLTLSTLPADQRLAAAREIHVPMDRSRHTFAVWARALDEYARVGLDDASARAGVPRRTLARWAKSARLRPGQ
jgi:hypothetical protein